MTTRARRSAGSKNYVGRLFFIKPKLELDIEDYRNGVTIKVAGMIRPLGASADQLATGSLHLSQGQPASWTGRNGYLLFAAPVEFNVIGGKIPFGGHMTKCLLSAKAKDFEISLPTLDIDLVRLALAE